MRWVRPRWTSPCDRLGRGERGTARNQHEGSSHSSEWSLLPLQVPYPTPPPFLAFKSLFSASPGCETAPTPNLVCPIHLWKESTDPDTQAQTSGSSWAAANMFSHHLIYSPTTPV